MPKKIAKHLTPATPAFTSPRGVRRTQIKQAKVAAAAWRRLLGNSCPDKDFLALALMQCAQVHRGLR